MTLEFIYQPSRSDRLGEFLKDGLSKNWTHFRAAVAFVKRSGTKHIAQALADFAQSGDVEIIVGIDHQGTSIEGLQDLLEAVSPDGRVVVFHNRLPFTFHPKIYLFKSADAADVMIGSGNLTEGGLFTNYEAAFRLSLDLKDPENAEFLQSIENILSGWADSKSGTAVILNNKNLAHLSELGLVHSEASAVAESESIGRDNVKVRSRRVRPLFAAARVPAAPAFRNPTGAPESVSKEPGSVAIPSSHIQESSDLDVTGFVMTLQQTDVGAGQTTKGAARRSPEIFIPLIARDAEPGFWNWPDDFTSDPGKPDKLDRQDVSMRLNGKIISVNMMYWPDKRDFRLRCEALRSAGNVGDILRMEKTDSTVSYEYDVEVIPQETNRYLEYFKQCKHPVSNSKKKYGYY